MSESDKYGISYSVNNFYGYSKSLSNAIFGDEKTNSITWSGNCNNGLANGYGVITITGETKGFWNNNKGYTEDVVFGVLKNGKYENCRVYDFNDFSTMLTTGEKAKKWNIYTNGLFTGVDLSEVEKVQAVYSEQIQAYKVNQKALSGNYELVLSKPGIATYPLHQPHIALMIKSLDLCGYGTR